MTIPKETPPGSGAYGFRYVTPDGKDAKPRFSKEGSPEKNLIAAWREWFKVYEPAGSNLLLADFVRDKWLPSRELEFARGKLAENTYEKQVGSDLPYVLDRFGTWRLGDIKRSHVLDWKNSLRLRSNGQEASEGTKRKINACLRSILQYAMDDDILTSNVASDLRTKRQRRRDRKPTRPVQPVTGEEYLRLLEFVPDRWTTMVVVAMRTGMRKNEIRSLRVDQFNPPPTALASVGTPSELTTDVQLNRHRQPVLLKTDTSERTLIVDGATMDLIRAHVHRFPPTSEGYLFPSEQGRVVSDKYPNEMMLAARRKAGLPDHVTWHNFRHGEVSDLLAAGMDIAAVGERVGMSPTTLVSRYLHAITEGRTRLRDHVLTRTGNLPEDSGVEQSISPGQG